MSIFTPKAGRQVGKLAFDVLTLARGEQITKRPISQPHHSECPTCHFDRWDGYSEHRWGGGRFAQRLCFGPTPSKAVPQPGQQSHPLVDELRGFASDVGEEITPEPELAVSTNPADTFVILGDARERE